MQTIDEWDPRVIDGIAREQWGIIFNNRGLGGSQGETPTTVQWLMMRLYSMKPLVFNYYPIKKSTLIECFFIYIIRFLGE